MVSRIAGIVWLGLCAAGIGAAPDELRTPPPPDAPQIAGPARYGVRPGRPLLYRIPCTGRRPIAFAAEGLPEGLALDPATGIVSGTIAGAAPKTHPVTLRASNEAGADARAWRIVVGDTIALTPPMGWNSWYVHYDRVTDAIMRAAADAMIASGMADAGYQYVNIDDCWPNAEKPRDAARVGPARDAAGNVLPNAHFPDMKAMTDYIHARGLKAGIYTSPGPRTCGGYTGAWEHEAQDARQFAAWGFDFLKYDWCSYGELAGENEPGAFEKPYRIMGDILRTLDRDIVFNLCQYGMGQVWRWGADVGGHCWRTAGDLGFELDAIYNVARRNAAHHPHAKPGAWNDPDYLLLGYTGDARGMGEPVPCALAPEAQYAYMSLWCLMAAPLIFSGDMARLDPFTVNVLCNPEVIAIDQDPMGRQGYPVDGGRRWAVWRKPLEGGAIAVGFFNLTKTPLDVTAAWSALEIAGPHAVRDPWRRRDLPQAEGSLTLALQPGSVELLRLTPAVR